MYNEGMYLPSLSKDTEPNYAIKHSRRLNLKFRRRYLLFSRNYQQTTTREFHALKVIIEAKAILANVLITTLISVQVSVENIVVCVEPPVARIFKIIFSRSANIYPMKIADE